MTNQVNEVLGATPDKRVEIKQDSASTYEIRVGSFVKGGIFAHDLGKFLTDTLTQHHQDLMSEERKRVLAILDEYEIDGEWQRNQMLRKIADDIEAQTIIKSLTPPT